MQLLQGKFWPSGGSSRRMKSRRQAVCEGGWGSSDE
jgi:hypothetical protein